MRCLILIFFLSLWGFSAEVRVGMSAAFTGPAKELGQNIRDGITLYFKKNNQENKKYKFKLIYYDDAYEPNLAAKNVRKLIDDDKVLALLGNVGTPTANVTIPIVNEKKILLFGAFTGAGILRKNPPDRYVINYRASYAQETATMINGLLSMGIKIEEIALFTQNDGYGDAGYFGVIKALNENYLNHTINKIQHGRYTRNTLNVEEGLATILGTLKDIKAVIIVGAYAPASKFIKLAKEDFPNAYFLNVSFVGSMALKKSLKENTNNVIITQVVPPLDSKLPIVEEYLSDMKKYSKKLTPNFVSLEGYIIAKIFVKAVNSIDEKNINRENVIDAIKKLKDIDIGLNMKLGFSNKQQQFSNKVWTTFIENGNFKEFNWNTIK